MEYLYIMNLLMVYPCITWAQDSLRKNQLKFYYFFMAAAGFNLGVAIRGLLFA